MSLLDFNSVSLKYNEQYIVQDLNFSLKPGEIVVLLGKSGSGKSSILKLLSKLTEPSEGQVKYCKELKREKISMVFQNFALLPWLNVRENIAIVLEAQNICPKEIDERIKSIIELIGLEGYMAAYPKELSGGMRQRVGIGRALAAKPQIMLMDEPFSALDILTASTLKNDLMDLWIAKKIDLQSIVLVTHNIEEALMMADKVIILSSNPGKVALDFQIDLPRPRDPKDPAFIKYFDELYSHFIAASQFGRKSQLKMANIYYSVPFFPINALYGLLRIVSENDTAVTLSTLETQCNLNASDLLSVTSFLELIKFIEIKDDNSVVMLPAGRILIDSNIQDKKKLFSEHLMKNLPIMSYICDTLKARPSHKAPRSRFLSLLEDHLSKSEANETLRAVTNWGRYTELFFYNDRTGQYYL